MEHKRVPQQGEQSTDDLNRLQHPAAQPERGLDPAEASRRALVAGRDSLEVAEFAGHWKKFGLGILTPQAIALVKDLAARERRGLVSIFSGLGYAEQQLASAGLDVVAYDRNVPEQRWFAPLMKGDMQSVAAHADRMLFMSFPDRDKSPCPALEAYRRCGGDIVILVTESREARHMFGSTPDLYEALAQANLEAQIELETWPTIVAPRVPSAPGFRPVMRIYRLDKQE